MNCMQKSQEQPVKNEGRCVYCSLKKNHNTTIHYSTCDSPICREHTIPSCPECRQKINRLKRSTTLLITFFSMLPLPG